MTRHTWEQRDYNGPVYAPCVTGKTGWTSRAAAKKALKRMAKGHGMGAYRCDQDPNCELWHVGHLAREIRRGVSER